MLVIPLYCFSYFLDFHPLSYIYVSGCKIIQQFMYMTYSMSFKLFYNENMFSVMTNIL